MKGHPVWGKPVRFCCIWNILETMGRYYMRIMAVKSTLWVTVRKVIACLVAFKELLKHWRKAVDWVKLDKQVLDILNKDGVDRGTSKYVCRSKQVKRIVRKTKRREEERSVWETASRKEERNDEKWKREINFSQLSLVWDIEWEV